MFEWLSIFSNPQTWVELITLIFLEMVLGIDNLVFIAITTDRLPEDKQHIGRRFGLMAALVMRVALLFSISWVMTLENPLFSLPFLSGDIAAVTGRELILFVGGIYLIYKGLIELVAKVSCKEEKAEHGHPDAVHKSIGLAQAIVTIAAMDIIFSLDSVITAVGMVGHLPVMVLAVMIAVIVMIIFADAISNFINQHPEIKILALTFIVLVGLMLVGEALSIHIEKMPVYFAMGFALVLDLIQMKYNKNLKKVKEECGLLPKDPE